MIVKFNKACFLDYSEERELKIDKIVEEYHEYLLSFDNVNALNQVHITLSYVGNIWKN